MADFEVRWDYPQYSAYSILNAVHPTVCWNTPQNNPMIKGFEVDYLDVEDNQWIRIGSTNTNYIRFPSDTYTTAGLYRIRIATIGINGRRSAYAFNNYTSSSPLTFDFTAAQDVRLANGTTVPNQRYLFLVI